VRLGTALCEELIHKGTIRRLIPAQRAEFVDRIHWPFHDDPRSVKADVDAITRRQPKCLAYLSRDHESALLTDPQRGIHA
jgi:hypothetical protein